MMNENQNRRTDNDDKEIEIKEFKTMIKRWKMKSENLKLKKCNRS